MQSVWIIETGEYEARQVFRVARSREAGIKQLKETYSPPYIVQWEEVPEGLIGTFEFVLGHSAAGKESFDFTEFDLDTGEPVPSGNR